MADAIGNLFISLGMQTAQFDQQLRSVDRKLQTFSKNANTALSAIKGAFFVEAGRQAIGWAQSMAAAGEEAENLALSLGTTLEKVVELQGVFLLTTGSLGEAAAAMTKMNAAVQDARGGSTDAIATFEAIGVTMKDLERVGGDQTEQLKLLADRWNAYRDSGEKTRIFQELFGKAFAKMLPVLQGGRQAVDAYIQKFKELNPAAEEAARKGGELDKAIDETTVSIKGLIDRGFVILQPLLLKAAEDMGAFARSLREAEERSNGLEGPLSRIVRYFSEGDAWLENLNKYIQRAAAATRAAAGLEPTLTIAEEKARAEAEKGRVLGSARLPPPLPGTPPDEPPGEPRPKPTPQPEKPTAGTKKRGGGGGGGRGKGGGGGGKGGGAAVDDTDYDAFADHIKEVRAEELARFEQSKVIADLQFEREKQRIEQQRDLEKATADEAIQLERDLTAKKWTADQEYYAKKREAAEGDGEAQQQIDDTVAQEHERHLTRMEAIDHQKAKSVFDRLKEGVRDFGSVIESSFSTIFDSVVDGTFKLKNAFSSLMRDMGKMIASRAFKVLMEGPEGGGGLGGLLTKGLGGIFGIAAKGAGAAGGGFTISGSSLGPGIPGAANGANWRVGGSGGIDSQLVAFNATPGEMVDVYHGGNRRGGGADELTINLNPSEGWVAGVADQRIVTASGQIVNVAVIELQKRVSRNFSNISSEARARQL